jgi:fatty acid desaturase
MAHGRLLSRAELVEFSKVNVWIIIGMMIFDWTVIAIAITVSLLYPNWIVYLLAVMFIGGRMHGLGILAHEVAHYRFIKNKKLGDWIANLFLTWPIFYSVDSFRKTHLAHHKHLNSEGDPDFMHKQGKWLFPRSRFAMIRMIIGDLTGINIPQTLIQNKVFAERAKRAGANSVAEAIGKIIYYGGLITVLIYFGWWDEFLWYWMLPYVTWLHMIFKLRSVAEHYAIYDQEKPEERTRTVLLTYLERFFITPHHINMHVEHHTYPSVPFYKLLKLHKHLARDPEYRKQNHFTKSFVGVIKECSEHKA